MCSSQSAASPSIWTAACIALGSNMGDKKAFLDAAVDAIRSDSHFREVIVSSYIETAPYGGVEQDDFLNAALICQTSFSPHALLDFLHAVENASGRVRTIRWGPRTLDLDILLYGDTVLQDPDLIIPHVEMHKRDFVLRPLVEIAPDAVHPVLKKTVRELFCQLKDLL